MKANLRLLGAACVMVLAPVFLAASEPAKPADKKDEAKCEHCKDGCKCEPGKCCCDKCDKEKDKDSGKKTVMLTGSHLPQTVTKVGRITDSAQPVSVITGEDLEKTGEMNLAAALRKTSPVFR